MTERLKEAAAELVQDEIGRFSRRVLGCEWPIDPKEPTPREDLEWVRQQRKRSEARQKYLGVFMVAIVTTIASVMVTSSWPQLLALFRGH